MNTKLAKFGVAKFKVSYGNGQKIFLVAEISLEKKNTEWKYAAATS